SLLQTTTLSSLQSSTQLSFSCFPPLLRSLFSLLLRHLHFSLALRLLLIPASQPRTTALQLLLSRSPPSAAVQAVAAGASRSPVHSTTTLAMPAATATLMRTPCIPAMPMHARRAITCMAITVPLPASASAVGVVMLGTACVLAGHGAADISIPAICTRWLPCI
ncbi:hypothetical protein DL89DRAFT_72422, partial [Linderina pennispora]